MQIRRLYIAVLLLAAFSMSAQVRVIKPVKKSKPKSTHLSFFGGFSSSELLLERNVQEDNAAHGYHFGMSYGITRVFRAGFEYTKYREINIAPTWYDINAETFEFNVHALARMGTTHAYFYPLLGVSYNVFQGYFTGEKDYL